LCFSTYRCKFLFHSTTPLHLLPSFYLFYFISPFHAKFRFSKFVLFSEGDDVSYYSYFSFFGLDTANGNIVSGMYFSSLKLFSNEKNEKLKRVKLWHVLLYLCNYFISLFITCSFIHFIFIEQTSTFELSNYEATTIVALYSGIAYAGMIHSFLLCLFIDYLII
jgi:hypothetical protein